ncbi:hypothetical protein [Anabaena sp. PCC 7108]|uniref:hypothetical protein n=1 Tax=Anabaena sp. PCC 7108 TaxID=163908 RepID=UPI00034700ED|nr:hypothetical protein [Anabaena sp. PCC 7108]
MLLLNRLNNINAQIDSYQEQIAELQRRVVELQAHAQEVQGAESAAESALVQVRTALDMITAICPDDIITFKAAIDALFAPEPLRLAAYEEIETTDPVEPNPPTNDEVVDVESSPVVEDQPEANGNGNGNGNGKTDSNSYSLLATVDDLKKIDRPTLIKLANKHKIPNFQNKTRDKLAEALAGKVTVDEITPAKTK